MFRCSLWHIHICKEDAGDADELEACEDGLSVLELPVSVLTISILHLL